MNEPIYKNIRCRIPLSDDDDTLLRRIAQQAYDQFSHYYPMADVCGEILDKLRSRHGLKLTIPQAQAFCALMGHALNNYELTDSERATCWFMLTQAIDEVCNSWLRVRVEILPL